MDKIVKLDLSGRPFEFPTFELDNVEYAKIVHEINKIKNLRCIVLSIRMVITIFTILKIMDLGIIIL